MAGNSRWQLPGRATGASVTRAMVTGCKGQVGTALFRAAGAYPGLEVTLLDRHGCDITKPASVKRAFSKSQPDVVINGAAFTNVDEAESQAGAAFEINAAGVGHLADACQEYNARLIHVSTDYVFDGTKVGWYEEDDELAPLGVYGRSKATGEAHARAIERHLILRTSWVYSPDGNNFVKTMLRLGAERSELSVVSDQLGCPTSAADIADGLLQLALGTGTDHELSGTFHMAGSDSATWFDLAVAIFELAGMSGVTVAPIPTEQYPTAAERPANSRLSSRRLRERANLALPGWTTSLRTVLQDLGQYQQRK